MEIGDKGTLKSGAPFEITGINTYTWTLTLKIWNKDELLVSKEWFEQNRALPRKVAV